MAYEFTAEEIEAFERQERLRFAEPEASAPVVRRLEAPDAASLPVLFQAETVDAAALEQVTEQNWANIALGLDVIEAQLVEQFRQRARATVAKAKQAYSAEMTQALAGGPPGKSQPATEAGEASSL